MEKLTRPTDASAFDRIYAIGDVHGQAGQLAALHTTIRVDLRARPALRPLLVHLGDYVDRGPNSAQCLAMLANGDPVAGVPTVNLMGNHERMMLDAFASPRAAPLWLENGGQRTLRSFGIPADAPWSAWERAVGAPTIDFLRALRLSFETARFVFVHAGVRPGVKMVSQKPADLLWIRREFLDWPGIMLPESPGKLIVHGHTPTDQPEIHSNRIGIDTNAARGGKLTCAALSTDSVYFLQV